MTEKTVCVKIYEERGGVKHNDVTLWLELQRATVIKDSVINQSINHLFAKYMNKQYKK